MASQIAATPLLTGEEALRVIEEGKTLPTEKTRRAIEWLKKKFVREDDGHGGTFIRVNMDV